MQNDVAINLEVEKEFNVSVDRLYKAWVTEEDLRQWWHPMNNRLKELVNELNEGGTVQYIFENDQAEHAFTISGRYKEVQEGQRLVYTWKWEMPTETVQDSEYLLTVAFEATGNGSRIRVKQDQFANEESVHPHREGWDKALDDLHQYLSAQA